MRRSEFRENWGLGFKGLWEGLRCGGGGGGLQQNGVVLGICWETSLPELATESPLLELGFWFDSILTEALLSSSSPFREREREKERAIFQKTMEAPTLKMLGFSGLYSGWVEWAELIRVYVDYKLGWARLFLGKYPKKTIVLLLHIKPWLSCIFG